MSKACIYLFNDMDSLGVSFINRNLHRLPASRQERCVKYRNEADKQACVLAYLLLEKGLSEQYGVSRPPEFDFNNHGKPFLRDSPHIFFNFSHCRFGVACALSDIEIGVDIQDIRPFDMDLARRVCGSEELMQLSDAGDPALLFCKIWARKEAYIKAQGISVAHILKRDLSSSEFVEWENKDYCVALSAKGESRINDVEIKRMSTRDMC